MAQSIKAHPGMGDGIRRARMAKGLTQEQLSSQLQLRGCDVSRGTLAKIEAGIRHLSVEELQALRAVLGLSYEDLFG